MKSNNTYNVYNRLKHQLLLEERVFLKEIKYDTIKIKKLMNSFKIYKRNINFLWVLFIIQAFGFGSMIFFGGGLFFILYNYLIFCILLYASIIGIITCFNEQDILDEETNLYQNKIQRAIMLRENIHSFPFLEDSDANYNTMISYTNNVLKRHKNT